MINECQIISFSSHVNDITDHQPCTTCSTCTLGKESQPIYVMILHLVFPNEISNSVSWIFWIPHTWGKIDFWFVCEVIYPVWPSGQYHACLAGKHETESHCFPSQQSTTTCPPLLAWGMSSRQVCCVHDYTVYTPVGGNGRCSTRCDS